VRIPRSDLSNASRMTRQSTKNPASQSQNTTQITEFHIARDLKAAHLPLRDDNVEPSEEGEPSEWIKAQPAFIGEQGKTVLDPDFDIDDAGLPHEKAQLPNR